MYGCSGGCSGSYGCGGGYGGASYGCAGGGCYGGAAYGAPVVMPSGGVPVAPKAPEKVKAPKETDTMLSAPATILVSLPEDAKLMIDETVTRSTSSTRVFVSPTLDNGKTYSYTLKAEAVRDGQTITASKKVEVRAGEETRVSLELPVAAVAAK